MLGQQVGKGGNLLLRGRLAWAQGAEGHLEGRELRALQTDGYNVYLYLDDEKLDIDHVCCMAHVRAKFKYAAEIEHDVNARKFLEYIGRLYALEKRYEEEKLSAEQVRYFRNSAETTGIIIEMSIIRKTKCSGISEQNVPFLKTKRTSVNLFPSPSTK